MDQAAGRGRAGRALSAGCRRHAVVTGSVGRAALRNRSNAEAVDAAALVLPLRALRARAMGLHRLSGLLRLVVGDVLDRGLLSEPVAEAAGLCRARYLCEGL